MALRGAAWIRAGAMPLWNPFQYCGHPFLATGIYGALYPFNFPYLLFPAAVAIEVVAVLHLAAAGVFLYAFTRTIGLGRSAAAVSGIVFMFSGYVVLLALWFPPAMCAATWLPLSLLAIERIARSRSIAWAIGLGAALALAFLAGWPQIWLYSLYAIAAYTAMRLAVAFRSPAERPHLVTIVVLLGLGGMVAAGLMMGQLLPGLELQAQGPRRAGGLSLEHMLVFGGPVSPSWLLQQIVDVAPDGPRMPYVGILALVLLPASLFVRPLRAWAGCFWIVMLFSLAVAASAHSPAFDLYRLLPGARLFRAPLRFLYLHAFAAAVLSGVGFAGLASAHTRLRAPARLSMTGLMGVAVVLAIAAAEASVQSRTCLALGLGLCCTAIWAPGRRWRSGACAALLAVVWSSLFFSVRNEFLHPHQDLTVVDSEHRMFDYIKAHQGFDRTYIHSQLEIAAMMAKQGTLREIYSITDYEPLSLRRYERFYRLLESPKDHRNPLHTFTGQLHTDPALPAFGLMDLLSVRYILVPKLDLTFRRAIQDRHPKWRAAPLDQLSTWWVIYENSDVLPRAYVATDVRRVNDGDAALAAIATPGFDPRTSVVLEGAPPSASTSDQPGRIEPAELLQYEPGSVTIEAVATNPGYLVLTDTFYPGWRATVDGVAVPIFQANYLFRAVPIDRGRHTVRFEYAPESFAIGIGITVATLIAAVLTLVALAWRAHTRQRLVI
jgi:hypothetical protein